MSNCGERLREERERLGFNQTAFGAIGGVQKQAQLKYEKGERFPDAAYLAAAAKIGADVQYIITGVRSSTALMPDEQELLRLFRAAPLAVKATTVAGLAAGTAIAGTPQSVVVSGSGNRVGVRDYHEHHASDEGKQQDGDAQQKP
jgi:transcriptional regulator with XRE-family HTH domain